MNHPGGYREAASPGVRVLDVRASLFRPLHLSVLLVVLPLLALFWLVIPARVEVTCAAASQVCVIQAHRRIGSRPPMRLDVHPVQSVQRIGGAFRVKTATDQVTFVPSGVGVGSLSMIETALRTFLANRTEDVTASHDPDARDFESLAYPLALGVVLLLALAWPLRLRVEAIDEQMTIRVSRRGTPLTFTLPTAEVTGAALIRLDGQGRAGAQLRLLTARGPVDLWPPGLHARPSVERLARALDRFVRRPTRPVPSPHPPAAPL